MKLINEVDIIKLLKGRSIIFWRGSTKKCLNKKIQMRKINTKSIAQKLNFRRLTNERYRGECPATKNVKVFVVFRQLKPKATVKRKPPVLIIKNYVVWKPQETIAKRIYPQLTFNVWCFSSLILL